MFSTRPMVKGKQAELKMGSQSFNPAYTDESRTNDIDRENQISDVGSCGWIYREWKEAVY